MTTLTAAVFRDLARPPGSTLRIGLVTSGAEARARHDGALLGIEEARHAAELFGGSAELVPIADAATIPPSVAAVLANEAPEIVRSLTVRASNGAFVVMNVACSADDLRGASCSPFAFHVAPSDAMLRDAKRMAHASDVTGWDGALVRFGADTLNDRFRKRFGRSMNAAAWASWFAVKALWESSLRMKSTDPRQLTDYLSRDTTQFDGHKGKPLSFRAWDHQLRQFVYARVNGKPADVPRGEAPDANSRDFLDQLGAAASASACRFRR